MTRRVSLAAVDDLLLGDGEGVALRGDRLVWLSPLAALMVKELESGPMSVDRLVHAAIAAFGAPPGPAEPWDAVLGALERLEQERLVTFI